MQDTEIATGKAQDEQAKAKYLCDTLTELRAIASDNDFDFLTYLIEMAVLESTAIVNGRISAARQETFTEPCVGRVGPEELAKMFMRGDLN